MRGMHCFGFALMIGAGLALCPQPSLAVRVHKTRIKPKSFQSIPAEIIPRYPGAKLELEVSLTHGDLLPYIIQALRGGLASPDPKETPQARKLDAMIDKMVAGVTRVEYLQQTVAPRQEVDPQKVFAYYDKLPAALRMRRIMYYVQPSGEMSALYSGPLGNGLFGIWIEEKDVLSRQGAGSQCWAVRVGMVQGKADFTHVVAVVSGVQAQIDKMKAQAAKQAKKAQPPTPEKH